MSTNYLKPRKSFRSRFGTIVSAIFYTALIVFICYATIDLFRMWTEEYSMRDPAPIERSAQ